jgi:hypothetical protein
MKEKYSIRRLTTKFLKIRWSKDWESHLDEVNIQKWESRINGIFMGFYEEFKLFDTKSRRAFYKTLRDFKMPKIAKELANYMRGEANKKRRYR